MKPAAVVRLAVVLGSAFLATGVMARIEDSTASQITGVAIALCGVIASRLIYARMD